MKQARGKKVLINTVAVILQEVVAVICGFILPRMILSTYGSSYNGVISSITQFLGCTVLLRAGIGGATRSALYKPLVTNDIDSINGIMSATNKFMNKISIILITGIFITACIYPFFIYSDFDWIFSFSLFIIIGISTFAESLFGITYLILLQADQKSYVNAFFSIGVYIANTIIAIILIKMDATIHIVKLGSSVVFLAYPIFLRMYVKKRYQLNLNVLPNDSAIGQRWDAFFHQAANFVMTNTDTIILTLFSRMTVVSIYSVYNLVINGVRKVLSNFTNSLEGTFGSIIALGEDKVLKEAFSVVEFLIYSIATCVYTCTWLLILPFIEIYTKGITDANYIQPIFATVLVIAQFCNCVRQPYQLIVQAAGCYKETKKGAIMEPVINIMISTIGVISFGIVGVALGTLVAMFFRTVQYVKYVSDNIIFSAFKSMIKNVGISIIEITLTIMLCINIQVNQAENYGTWILYAIIVFIISISVIVIISYVLHRNEIKILLAKLRNLKK